MKDLLNNFRDKNSVLPRAKTSLYDIELNLIYR